MDLYLLFQVKQLAIRSNVLSFQPSTSKQKIPANKYKWSGVKITRDSAPGQGGQRNYLKKWADINNGRENGGGYCDNLLYKNIMSETKDVRMIELTWLTGKKIEGVMHALPLSSLWGF